MDTELVTVESQIDARALLQRVESRLIASGGITLKRSEFQRSEGLTFRSADDLDAWDAAQEIRLRMTIALIAAGRSGDSDVAAPPLTWNGGVVREASGVAHASWDRHAIILVPQTIDPLHVSAVIRDLHRIYSESRDRSWIVDLATVSDLPRPILFALIGFGTSLFDTGRTLALSWMKPTCLRGSTLDRARELLDLQFRCGNYFSKNVHFPFGLEG